MQKQCKTCGDTKDCSLFSPDKRRKDGLGSYCRDCRNKYLRELNKADPAKAKGRNERYKNNHPERVRLNGLKAQQKYAATHPQTVKARYARWYETNRSYHRDYARHQRKHNIQYQLASNLRRRLRDAVREGSAVKNLGCTITELRHYLEAKFQPGMTWKNYGRGEGRWTIDHVRPLSTFDLENPADLKQACHYTNLQPMWWLENLVKGGTNRYKWR